MGRKKYIFIVILVILFFVSVQLLFSGEPRFYPMIQNHHVGIINQRGEVVVEPKYLEVGKPSDGWVAVRESSQWEYQSLSGKKTIEVKFDQAGPFVNGLAPANKNEMNGFIDETGNWVKTGFSFVDAFSEGFAVVGSETGVYFVNEKFENQFQSQFEDAGAFQDGEAPVKRNNRWGVINHLGEQIVPFRFEEMPLIGKEGIVGVMNGRYGMMDPSGIELIPFHYERLLPMSENRIGYYDGQKWGFLDAQNGVAIPALYTSVTPFQDGRAYVIEDGLGLVIDWMGNSIGEGKFEEFDLESLLYSAAFTYRFYTELKAPFEEHEKLILDNQTWKVITDQGETIWKGIEEGFYE